MAARNSSGYSKKDADLIRDLRQRVQQAIDATAGSNGQRERAWRQFALEPNQSEETGRSAIQSADVNSMITATLAQCVVAFSNDTVVNFEANSAEDEAQAKMESRALNKILIEQNGGFSDSSMPPKTRSCTKSAMSRFFGTMTSNSIS